MLKKTKTYFIKYLMLLAGIVLLLSVIIPHHHHEDGIPCYKSLTESHHHADTAHGCCCDGHNLAFFSSLQIHVTDVDANMYLQPLLVLFDYVNPPEPVLCDCSFHRESAVYIESLHDTWIVSASGLRAPPVC